MSQPNTKASDGPKLDGRTGSAKTACWGLYWLFLACSNFASWMLWGRESFGWFVMAICFLWVGFGPNGKSPNSGMNDSVRP